MDRRGRGGSAQRKVGVCCPKFAAAYLKVVGGVCTVWVGAEWV